MHQKQSAQPRNAELSASNFSANPTTSTPKPGKFTPRQQRALDALALGWIAREAFDRATGCSNGPDLVRQLRQKLGDDAIETRHVDAIDRDGHPCKPGQYRLTETGRQRLEQKGGRHA